MQAIFNFSEFTKELLTHGEVCVCGWQKRNDPAVKQNATHKEESLRGFQVFVRVLAHQQVLVLKDQRMELY